MGSDSMMSSFAVCSGSCQTAEGRGPLVVRVFYFSDVPSLTLVRSYLQLKHKARGEFA